MASKNTKSKQRRVAVRFAVCVRNEGYPASLEVRKIYRMIPDAAAADSGLIRIVDESDEDYLYPATFFVPITLSKAVRELLAAVG